MLRTAISFVILFGGFFPTHAQESQPATGTASSPAEMQSAPDTAAAVQLREARIADLVALIEGPNSPDVRRTGVRQLLLLGYEDVPKRLAAILSGSNAGARTAIALTLVEQPVYLDAVFIDPLIATLADGDAEVRTAAAAALAAYPNHGVTDRLRGLVLDAATPRAQRLAAVASLALVTDRNAIEALVAALEADPVVAQAALLALEQATGMDFLGSAGTAREWWQATTTLSREEWQQQQIERLVRKARETQRRLTELESRLARVLEESFQRAGDAERTTLLAAYLTDPDSNIRLLGLTLARRHLAEGKALPADIQQRLREFMNSPNPRKQAAAIRAVAGLRQSEDAATFLRLLETNPPREIRLALVNGLGFIGNGTSTTALMPLLRDLDEATATEAAAAIGRIAERGRLGIEATPVIAEALLDAWGVTLPGQTNLRERLLWAMGNVGDARFATAFAAALNRENAANVRQAAVRGIATLRLTQLADALLAAAGDPDAGVRRLAVETLGDLAASSNIAHLEALWDRVDSPPETDESIRQIAWRSTVDVLARGTTEDLGRWLARLTESGESLQRVPDLLQQLIVLTAETEPVDRARRGLLRSQLAAMHARIGSAEPAIDTWVAALGDLHAAAARETPAVAVDLLRYALRNDQYDEIVANTLAAGNPGLEPEAIWRTVLTELENRLGARAAEPVIALLNTLEQHPPVPLNDDVRAALADLRTRALGLRQPPPTTATAPATLPAHGADDTED
ncbi:MAG: HEAT repeat domain-containing protein [Phycisphaerales bacterium]|nr:HEAT repeat domain-containing protein [Phycisphaerales bacterium]